MFEILTKSIFVPNPILVRVAKEPCAAKLGITSTIAPKGKNQSKQKLLDRRKELGTSVFSCWLLLPSSHEERSFFSKHKLCREETSAEGEGPKNSPEKAQKHRTIIIPTFQTRKLSYKQHLTPAHTASKYESIAFQAKQPDSRCLNFCH